MSRLTYPLPANEKERLNRLLDLGVLDTQADPYLDGLTKLASTICKTPFAFISLIDSRRQWFKSAVGLDVKETPREVAFCAHAITQNDVFVVEDATRDQRFKDNPLVTGDPNVRFYAGAPIKTRDGYNIGTLCVIDQKPGFVDAGQAKILETLADQVILFLDNQRLLKILAQREAELCMALERSLQSQIYYRMIFENSPLGVIQLDENFKIAAANPAYCRMTGYTEAELLDGMSVKDFTHPEDLELTDAEKRQVSPGARLSLRKRYIRKDGETVWVDIVSQSICIQGKDEVFTFSIVEDVTELLKQEALLKSAQMRAIASSKLAAIGEIVAGMAHEINNPMATIQGRVSLLKSRLESEDANTEKCLGDLQIIEKTTTRVVKIIKGLRALSRDADHDPMQRARLAPLVKDALEFGEERIANAKFKLRSNVPEDLELDCRPTQITQILVNLLVNAIDAISGHADQWVQVDAFADGGDVVIRVSDCGTGLSKAVIDQMMNPFFTTKEAGKGSGLGLSISKRIADSHHGVLTYDSRAPNTTFELRIPRFQKSEKSKVA